MHRSQDAKPWMQAYAGVPVALTGASGFVGRQLLRRLQEVGALVTVLAREPARMDPQLVSRCTVVQGNLLDRAALARLLSGAAHVFHCAADVATWGHFENYLSTNVQGVQALLDELCKQRSTLRRLVHISTLDVYGFPRLAVSEDTPLEPVRYGYGESKRLGDLLVQSFCRQHALPYVVMRAGNIVGPGSPFVSRIASALRTGPMLCIDGGRHHAGLLDVENLLDVLLWAGISTSAAGQVYNVRDPWAVCWSDYLRDFRQGSGLKGWMLDLDYRLAMPLASALSAPWRWLDLQSEPLLHPLIVQIFGRTCGHSIDKLLAHGAPIGRVDYASSMRESLAWLAAKPSFTPKKI